MTTVIKMTSGMTFSDVRSMVQRAVGGGFGYDLRCEGTNGPTVQAELEILGLCDEDQAELTKLFAESVQPVLANYFNQFEIVVK